MNRNKYCIANWKMNFIDKEINKFIESFKCEPVKSKIFNSDINIILCPSYIYLKETINKTKKLNLSISAQNVSNNHNGPFTGEISCEMLQNIDCNWSIIGHSERRSIYKENNNIINFKLAQMVKSRMNIILCIGESLEERKSNNTENILFKQLSILNKYDNIDNLVIAYEPVWAIGTGVVASEKMINETHAKIRLILNDLGYIGKKISVLYGGSVNEINAIKLANIDEIDGFLVGSASLDFNKFFTIFETL